LGSEVDGVPVEQIVTGYALAAAADAACGGLEGRTIAIEGFGKVGGGVAREAARRAARITAVSTVEGCVISQSGFVVDDLWELRAEYGDGWCSTPASTSCRLKHCSACRQTSWYPAPARHPSTRESPSGSLSSTWCPARMCPTRL
jgi:hypothetical protein